MAKVTVVVTGRSSTAGTAPLVIDCEAASVAEALAEAGAASGIPLLRRDGSAPSPGMCVFVDGKALRPGEGAAAELRDGEVVAVIRACADS